MKQDCETKLYSINRGSLISPVKSSTPIYVQDIDEEYKESLAPLSIGQVNAKCDAPKDTNVNERHACEDSNENDNHKDTANKESDNLQGSKNENQKEEGERYEDGQTMEEFIRNIQQNNVQWTDEERKNNAAARIRRKIMEGSYPNSTVEEDKLPTLLR